MNIKKLRDTYNKIANDYLREHTKDWDLDYIELFTKNVTSGGRILDLGCGPGEESQMFVEKGFEAHGFDLSEKLLELARAHCPKGHFSQGDMHNLPYEDAFFDGVFAKASLLHIPKNDMSAVLKEITRVLKPGGVLHIAIKKGEGEGEVGDPRYNAERFYAFWQREEFWSEVMKFPYKLIVDEEYTRPGGKTTWLKFLFWKR